MDDLLKNLKELQTKYYDHYQEVREKIRDLEEVPLAEALLGKCYKYKNSYGSNQDWWLYRRVIRRDGTSVRINSFQEDTHGKIEFEYDDIAYVGSFGSSNSILITEKEYFAAEKRLLDKMFKRHEKRGKK